MNILIVNHNGGSIYHGPNLRTYYVAKELVMRGHKVTIATSSYSHKYIVAPKIHGLVTAEVIDGIDYRWIRCIPYKNLLQRIYSHFEFGIKLLLNKNQICPAADLVIFSGPPPEVFLFASKLSKSLNTPIISDIRDFWPLTQIEMNKFQWLNPYTYFLYICQFFMIRRSNHIVSPLPGAAKYVSKISAETPTSIIQNSCATSSELAAEPLVLNVKAAGKALNLVDGSDLPLSGITSMKRIVVGYSGSFDRDNDIDSLIQAAARLKHRDDILFMFVGGGLRMDYLIKATGSIGNLLICDRVPSQMVPNVLKVMDVCYCGLKPKDIYKYGVSLAKSYEYMAAKKPIIWMIEACNNLVKDSGGGFDVEPGNVDELVKTIEYCASLETKKLVELGNIGHEYLLSNYSYNVLGDQWDALVQEYTK